MFTDLKPYPINRAVGLPWLRSVPEGWLVERAKTLLKPVDVRSTDGDEELLTVSSTRGIVRRSSATVSMFRATSYAGHKLCWPGDLVINSLWAWGRGLGVSTHHGIVSTAYGVYRSRNTDKVNPDFLHELVRSAPFQWELQVRSRGVWRSRLQLTDDQFLCAPLPLPPMVEQAAIVKYLGHANARIDRAIAAKRRLIALLEEQKGAIINQAVTRGLDPTVPLKDSGIPWFDQIPAHWQVRKLRSLFRRQGSGTTPADEGDYGGGVPWVMSGDLNDTIILTTKRTITSEALRRVSSLKLYPLGSLVVAMYGATIGKTGMMETAAATNQACCVFYKPSADVDARFAQYAVRTGKPGLLVAAFGGGQPNVNAEVVKQLRLPLPPLDEQILITTHLARSDEQFTLGTDRLLRQIELLREFRTRLTADVVTGQLDIRDAAARLPELDPAVLVSEVGTDEDDFDAVLAPSLEEVDA